VYCEANFGAVDGKTANGLVRHSEKYEILSVIDSEKAGLDAGMVLGEEPNAIPVCRDLADAMTRIGGRRNSLHRSGTGLLHLRDGAGERNVVETRTQPGARGDIPRNERRERPP
jgi:hypothetical protein